MRSSAFPAAPRGNYETSLERSRDVIVYIGLACFLGTTVNAAFNVVSLTYAGEVSPDDFFSSMVVWWVPNAWQDWW